MDNKTLIALGGSIYKWDQIAAGMLFDHGTQNCPLCALFYDKWEEGDVAHGYCFRCPVSEKTGKPLCKDTPYMNFTAIEHEDRYGDEGKLYTISGVASKAATAEANFLRSLISNGKAK